MFDIFLEKRRREISLNNHVFFIFDLEKIDAPQTASIGSAFMPWSLHREPPVAHQNARRQLATRLTYHVPEPTTTLFHHFR